MAENEVNKDQAAAEGSKDQQFYIQKLYLKDLSFEAPMGAKVFIDQIQPKIDQELGTETKKISESLYEVVLKLTLTAKVEEETAFLIEIQQAGLFQISGIEQSHLARVMNTVCPHILLPYAREAIDSTLTKGGFPALMLPPINFEALFAQAMSEKQKAAH
ncbi:MAG: preprotein translocase subunit SecB [Cellvibrionaceae bacterium]|jgi:preprotein translocase subunit SecB